jgi:hypothetical protein
MSTELERMGELVRRMKAAGTTYLEVVSLSEAEELAGGEAGRRTVSIS